MKKTGLAMASLLLMTGVAAGCGKSSDDNNAKESAASGGSPSASSSAASGKGGGNLKIYMTTQDAPGAEQLAKQFGDENGVAVSIERAPDEQYVQTLSTRLAANDGPDLWLDWPEVSKIKARIKAGYVEDLSGLSVLSTINDKMLAPFSVEGKVYGIPWALNFMGLYYNKDLFEKNGYAIPTNYDELIKLGEDLKSKGIVPIALNGKDEWSVQFPWFDLVASTVYSQAKDPKWDEKRYANETTFADSELWKDSAQKYDNLYQKEFFGKKGDLVGVTYDQAKKMFSEGKAAMIVDGSWSLQSYKEMAEQTKMTIGTMALPGNNAGEETYLTAAPSTGFAVWSGSPNKELAKKFLEYVYSDANASALAGEGALITKKTVETKPDPIFADVMKFIDDGKTYEFCNINWPNGPQAEGLQKETQAALAGAASFDKVLQTLDKAWDKNNK